MGRMAALSTQQTVIIGLLIVCYLAVCLRTALRMARTGRSLWLWLLITVFLTSIPATVVLMREQFRAVGRGRRGPADEPRHERPFRCRHCRKLVRPADVDHSSGVAACPHCGLALDEAETG